MDQISLQQHLGTRPLRYLASVGSTMSEAARWLAENPRLASGAVVVADEQTQGKGRLGRGWLTPPGSAIAMSVILRGSPPLLTAAGGLAVADALQAYTPTTMKWPNDVLIGGKKVCGVLAESLWEGGKPYAAILGMGINLTVDFAGTELADKATSLGDHTRDSIVREALIAAVLARLDHWLGSAGLFAAWRARLAMLGETVTLYQGETAITGTALDVDRAGALLLRLPDGSLGRFLAGDVTLNG